MAFRLLFVVVILLSCSATRMTETVLYFGQSRPDGSMIHENDWNDFKEKHLSVAFSEGYSVVQIRGFWKDPVTDTLVTEPTYQVIYYHKPSAIISRKIDSLRLQYKQLFRQQSVLRVDKKVRATF
jgi:hypothetical protein